MTKGTSTAIDFTHGARPAHSISSPATARRALRTAMGTLMASMVAIALYFGGAGDYWGPINDILVAATVLLLLPAIAVVRRLGAPHAGGWLTLLSLAAGAGAVVIASGQLALVLGLIDLETSFLTGSLGILPLLAWAGGTAELALRGRTLDRSVGWWAIALLVTVLVTAVALPTTSMDTPTASLIFGGPLLVTLLGWMLSLSRTLARRSG
jgi:hypothetical protein